MRGDIKNMTGDSWDIDGHSVYVLQDALGGDAMGWGACLGVLWRWPAGAADLTVALGTGLRTRYPLVGDDDVPVKVAGLGGAVKFPITRRAV